MFRIMGAQMSTRKEMPQTICPWTVGERDDLFLHKHLKFVSLATKVQCIARENKVAVQ